ncbi:MAG TPA: hypothetical protein VNT75_09405 [Symbiobacteriaceae bacterium]|nr:hypothetical protein [Symbiobacteriaceae bacterium]
MERRPNERAMHETFLVIKAAQTDMGSRPLTGPFATQDISVGSDGRPRAVIWNLGTRSVEGVVTEFASVPAGQPIRAENCKLIGMGNVANIPANSCVTVTCQAIWPRMSTADVLMVTAYHPDLDPVKAACDPLADRHVGQMNYAWAGTWEGKAGGQTGFKVRVEIRPANKGLFRVRLFQSIEGRMPGNPQVDRIMAPNGVQFRWLEITSTRRDDWEMIMLDNSRMSLRLRSRLLDGTNKGDQEVTGGLERV